MPEPGRIERGSPQMPLPLPGENSSPADQKKALKVQEARKEALRKEGPPTAKMHIVPREKIVSNFSLFSRIGSWIQDVIQGLFGIMKAKVKETTPVNAPMLPSDRKAAFIKRFQALPADQQRLCLIKMQAALIASDQLGKEGMFRLSGEIAKTEAMEETLLVQSEKTPGDALEVDVPTAGEIDNLANAYKTFLGAYVERTLKEEGYAALKSGEKPSMTQILQGLSQEDKQFLENFFVFYRDFARIQSQRTENPLSSGSVAMLFAPNFVREADQSDLSVFKDVSKSLEALILKPTPGLQSRTQKRQRIFDRMKPPT